MTVAQVTMLKKTGIEYRNQLDVMCGPKQEHNKSIFVAEHAIKME
jgi:hypothetical protein